MNEYQKKQQLENRPLLVDGLRKLADVFEQHPMLQVPTWKQDITVWVSNRDDDEDPDHVKNTFKHFLKVLGGTAKDTSDYTFELSWDFGLIRLRLCTDRDNVCEKVVTGTKILPATEAYTVEAQPEREEEVYEWRCTSLMRD